jgi:putative transposase
VRDRAGQFTAAFDAAFAVAGIKVMTILPQSPRANAYAEGWIPRCDRVTDRMLIAGARHLHAVLNGYVAHCNQHRPHRARGMRPPDRDDTPMVAVTDMTMARVLRRRVLGGLVNEYRQSA